MGQLYLNWGTTPWTRIEETAIQDLLLAEGMDEAEGFRHAAPGQVASAPTAAARGRERWVINKVRALSAWYTKGLIGGSDLRVTINHTESIAQLRETIEAFFQAEPVRI